MGGYLGLHAPPSTSQQFRQWIENVNRVSGMLRSSLVEQDVCSTLCCNRMCKVSFILTLLFVDPPAIYSPDATPFPGTALEGMAVAEEPPFFS